MQEEKIFYHLNSKKRVINQSKMKEIFENKIRSNPEKSQKDINLSLGIYCKTKTKIPGYTSCFDVRIDSDYYSDTDDE